MPHFPHRAAFSFDIEDWFHSELHHVADARPEESIVVRGTNAIFAPEADFAVARMWLAMLLSFDAVFLSLALWTARPMLGE